MKKVFIIISLSCLVISCGNNETKNDTKQVAAEDKVASPGDNPDYAKGLNLIAKNDCLTCHKATEKLIGPAYADVAAKYTFTDDVIDSLAQTIINGSVGKWGPVPMNSHPTLTKEDAKTMVKYIMTLKK